MTRSLLPHSLRSIPAAAVLAISAAPALAQGTAAEREACTSDAITLCSDAIPDIPKTTACMKAHVSQLTPRCRAVVVARPEQPPSAPSRHARREGPPNEAAETGSRRHRYAAPAQDAVETSRRRHRYAAPDGDEATDRDDAYGSPDEADRRYVDGPRDADGYDGPGDAYSPYGAPDADEPGARRYIYTAPDGGEAEAPEPSDRARASARIGRLCDDDTIDPETCALTERALRR